MRRRHLLSWISVLWTLPICAGVISTESVLAQSVPQPFSFFGGRDIDYWNEGKSSAEYQHLSRQTTEQQLMPQNFSGSTVVRAKDSEPFAWSHYRDPRSPEFWDDGGDWIPPRPFREAAAKPNAENINEYLAWQGRKAAVLTRLQDALAAQAAKMTDEPAAQLPWQEFEIVYFYQSACPHCRSSKSTIEKARSRGAKFTFVQLDHDTEQPLHTPSLPYDAAWQEQMSVSVTPTWILRFRGKTAMHTGAMRLADLERALKTLMNQETQR